MPKKSQTPTITVQIEANRSHADTLTMPNIWAIGDVQGCYDQLESLLEHPEIRDDPNCKLWFAGDIINRGKGSLKTIIDEIVDLYSGTNASLNFEKIKGTSQLIESTLAILNFSR